MYCRPMFEQTLPYSAELGHQSQ